MTDTRTPARQRGYTTRWDKARASYLRSHPLCAYCQRQGRVTAATVVDHIVPHKGDSALFWDTDNWQPLCKPCHDGIKQREERGDVSGCGVDGMPTSGAHPWARMAQGGGEKLRACEAGPVRAPTHAVTAKFEG